MSLTFMGKIDFKFKKTIDKQNKKLFAYKDCFCMFC